MPETIHKAAGIIGQNLETFDFGEDREVTELTALHHQQSNPPPHTPETVELIFQQTLSAVLSWRMF